MRLFLWIEEPKASIGPSDKCQVVGRLLLHVGHTNTNVQENLPMAVPNGAFFSPRFRYMGRENDSDYSRPSWIPANLASGVETLVKSSFPPNHRLPRQKCSVGRPSRTDADINPRACRVIGTLARLGPATAVLAHRTLFDVAFIIPVLLESWHYLA